jgi:hypothetical protein
VPTGAATITESEQEMAGKEQDEHVGDYESEDVSVKQLIHSTLNATMHTASIAYRLMILPLLITTIAPAAASKRQEGY